MQQSEIDSESDRCEEETSPTLSPDTRSRRRSIWLDTWLFEYVSLAFSISCFIAICVLLKVYDNKERPETFPYHLSLNAIISILSTGCKSSLVLVNGEAICQLKWLHFQGKKQTQLLNMQSYDAASRGPLGSLIILFYHRGKTLVSLGAVVMVLLLTFDPFIQQVVSFPLQRVYAEDGSATAQQVRPLHINYSDNSLPDDPNTSNSFGKALYSNESPDVQPTCTTGNCTWEEFPSLGICHKCLDITEYVRVQCNSPTPTPEEFYNQTCQIVMPQSDEYNFTISRDEANSATYDFSSGNTSYMTIVESPMAWQPYKELSSLADNATHAGVRYPLSVFVYADIRLEGQVLRSNPISDSIVLNVTECVYLTCLRDYQISVINGNASIQTVGVDYGITTSEPIADRGNRRCWSPLTHSKGEFYHCGDSIADTPTSDINYLLDTFFPAIGYSGYLPSNEKWTVLSDKQQDPVLSRIQSIGFEEIMAKTASFWTQEELRSSKSTVKGAVYSEKVFVSVQWYWLILPAFLVVTGTAFFTATVAMNRGRNMPLWKSSALAPFFHGLERVEGNELATNTVMEITAENANCRLLYSEDHGRLILKS